MFSSIKRYGMYVLAIFGVVGIFSFWRYSEARNSSYEFDKWITGRN